ncbi:MAG: hypothetical protein Q8L85_09385 [Alphaproteobacteria bacterium]|nr:hypothetical protein [Alphaproteobacteria bacterium]
MNDYVFSIDIEKTHLKMALKTEKCGFKLESKCVGSVFKPLSDDLRIDRHYVRLNTDHIKSKDVSW